MPEEEASKRRHVDEDVIIDVTTIEKANPYNDSDTEDGEEETFYLPLLPSDQQGEELLHTKHHHRLSRRHPTTHQHNKHVRDRYDSHHPHSKQNSGSNNNNNSTTSHHTRDGGADSAADSYKDDSHHQRRRDQKDRDHGSLGSDKFSSSSSSAKPKKRSDEYYDQEGGRDYENGHLGHGHGQSSGNGYDREQQQQHSRRKLEDPQAHSRSIKRQRWEGNYDMKTNAVFSQKINEV